MFWDMSEQITEKQFADGISQSHLRPECNDDY